MSSSTLSDLPCWSYTGDQAPAHWGQLHPDWSRCADGEQQSPIALPAEASRSPLNFTLDYRSVQARRSARTYAVQVDLEAGCTLALDGQTYELLQFHFHTPSEHHWAGQMQAGELHLVHRARGGEIVVIAVALDPATRPECLATLWSHLKESAPFAFDPTALLPASSAYLTYPGSLTTPPCSEGVRWLVAIQALGIDVRARAWLIQQTGDNARPLQAMHGRTVTQIAGPV